VDEAEVDGKERRRQEARHAPAVPRGEVAAERAAAQVGERAGRREPRERLRARLGRAQLRDERGRGALRLLDEADDHAREDEEAQVLGDAHQQVRDRRADERQLQRALAAEAIVAKVADDEAAYDLRGTVDRRDEAVLRRRDAELGEAMDEVRHDEHHAEQVEEDNQLQVELRVLRVLRAAGRRAARELRGLRGRLGRRAGWAPCALGWRLCARWHGRSARIAGAESANSRRRECAICDSQRRESPLRAVLANPAVLWLLNTAHFEIAR